MKEYRPYLVAIIFLLIIPLVLANLEIQESTLNFGGSSYEKSSNAIKESFTLENKGTEKLTGLSHTFNANSFNNANVVVNFPNTELDPGNTMSVDVEVTPSDFDIVDSDLEERGEIDIGDIIIDGAEETSGNNMQSNSVRLTLELENNLEVDSMELEYEDGSTKSVTDGNTYTIIEDEDMLLRVKVKNTFSNNGLDLESITVKLESSKLDIEEEEDAEDLSAEDDDEVEFSFSVDELEKEEVEILLEGQDEFSGRHGEKVTFKFDVEAKEEEEEPEEEEEASEDDEDGDGVSDVQDLCPNTVSVCSVDNDGCPLDNDGDGTCNDLDATPNGNGEEEAEETIQPVKSISPLQQRLEEEKNEKTAEEPAENGETEGIIPFLIGFVIGICLTAGFFFLIRS